MSKSTFFRIGGWSALLAAVVTLIAAVTLNAMPDNTTAAAILSVVGVVVLTPVFYALYVAHRDESAGPSLAALGTWAVAFVLLLAGALDPTNMALYAVSSLALAVTFLSFGLLAYRSTAWPRWFAAVVVLAGVFFAISGAVCFNATNDVGTATAAVGSVLLLVWLVGLWRMFSSKGVAMA